ncbi:MAG: hypothetical protein GY796_11055 [Chloroflexi bacterium]|nr:hypothetical protein [Chloroflexota bacterium]
MPQSTNITTDMQQFIQQIPKAEIHIHLEGAIQPETALELARRHKLTHLLTGDDVATLRHWFDFTDFDHFLKIYVTFQDLIPGCKIKSSI